jgi:hypothetical protein
MRCLLVVVFVAILLAAADLIRADSPQLLRNFKIIVEDIGNSVDTVG